MKRFIPLILILVIVSIFVGCGNISSEKAIDIALADLGLTRVGAARTDAVLDKGRNPVSYIVKIDLNDHLVTFIIDAKTGDILSSETTTK